MSQSAAAPGFDKLNPSRNSLGAAHAAAEGLYDNVSNLALLLDAWSIYGRDPALTENAAAYLRHNLINAQSNLDALRQALADALDAQRP